MIFRPKPLFQASLGGRRTRVKTLTPFPQADIRDALGREHKVASNTAKSENIRLRKKQKAGKKRKRLLERKGTTKNEAQLFGAKS